MASVQINIGREALKISPFSNPKNEFGKIIEYIEGADTRWGIRIYEYPPPYLYISLEKGGFGWVSVL